MLALDLGTSRTKAALLDSQGGVVSDVMSRPTSQDPNELLDSVAGVIDDLVDQASVPVAGVAMSSYWHGLVFVGDDFAALGPISTWEDSRAADSAVALAEIVPRDVYHRRTGCFLHPSFPFVRIHNLAMSPARHEVRWAMGPADWLMLNFFGKAVTSPSLASGTGMTEVGGDRYDLALLQLASISETELPVPSIEPLIGLCSPWAERWPILVSAPWHLPVGDGACSTLGSGGYHCGPAALNLGTSGAVRVIVDGRPEPPADLFVYRIKGERYLVGAAVSNAGNVVEWAKQVLRLPEDALLGEMQGRSLDAKAHLAGERNPTWAIDSSGSIEGLCLDTTALDILYALIGSITDDMAAAVRSLDDWLGYQPDLLASGGTLEAEPAIGQMLADKVGRAFRPAAHDEPGLWGAAMLAFEDWGPNIA